MNTSLPTKPKNVANCVGSRNGASPKKAPAAMSRTSRTGNRRLAVLLFTQQSRRPKSARIKGPAHTWRTGGADLFEQQPQRSRQAAKERNEGRKERFRGGRGAADRTPPLLNSSPPS